MPGLKCQGARLTWGVRISNVIVVLFGVALIIYGIWAAAEARSFGPPAAVPFFLGLIDLVLGLLAVLWCSERLFFIRLFLLVEGLLWVGEFIVAILFLVPATQQNMINSMDLESQVSNFVASDIAKAGYIFIAVVCSKGVAIGMAVLQSFALVKGFDESMGGDSNKLLGGIDKFGAMYDEGESEAAASRYRDKHAAMYERYNIKK